MSSELSQTSLPKLLNQVVARLLIKHYSLRTEKSYVIRLNAIFGIMASATPLEICAVEVEDFIKSFAGSAYLARGVGRYSARKKSGEIGGCC